MRKCQGSKEERNVKIIALMRKCQGSKEERNV